MNGQTALAVRVTPRTLTTEDVAHGVYHARRSIRREANEWRQAREPWNCSCGGPK